MFSIKNKYVANFSLFQKCLLLRCNGGRFAYLFSVFPRVVSCHHPPYRGPDVYKEPRRRKRSKHATVWTEEAPVERCPSPLRRIMNDYCNSWTYVWDSFPSYFVKSNRVLLCAVIRQKRSLKFSFKISFKSYAEPPVAAIPHTKFFHRTNSFYCVCSDQTAELMVIYRGVQCKKKIALCKLWAAKNICSFCGEQLIQYESNLPHIHPINI